MRTTPILTIVITLAVALSWGGAAAHAQAKPKPAPTQKQLDEARKHFKAAEAAKARGEYQTAAVEYLAAYELFQEPAFFFDTAEVYRLAGDEKNAITYYEKYLELDPSGQGAAGAREALDKLRHSVAAKEDAAKAKAAEDAAKAADAGKGKETGKPALVGPAHPATPGPDAGVTTTATPPGRTLRIAGLATAGAGVIVLGAGIYFGLHAKSLSNDAAGWDTFDQGKYDDGKAANRNMYIFTGIGAAAVIGGGVLYYLGHSAGKSGAAAEAGDAVTFAPIVGPSQITFAASGRF
jgi:tetratricopeptide (TPR) repeat protein